MKCRRSGSGDDLQVQGEEKVSPEPSESQNGNRGLEMDLQQELEPNYSTAGRKVPHLLSPILQSLAGASYWPNLARNREQGSQGVHPVEVSLPGHRMDLGSKLDNNQHTHMLSGKMDIISPFYSWTN